MKALGMIEVYGYLTAVVALDSALKAADVHLLDVTCVKGGLVTVLVTGDVGAIKAAMDASSASVEKVGKVVSVHVIPRPAESIGAMLTQKKPVIEKQEPERKESPEVKQVTSGNEVKTDPSIKEETTKEVITKENTQDKPKPPENRTVDTSKITVETMKGMTVEQLRNLARQIGITNMTRKEIKFGNKNQLIQAISKFLEQER